MSRKKLKNGFTRWRWVEEPGKARVLRYRVIKFHSMFGNHRFPGGARLVF